MPQDYYEMWYYCENCGHHFRREIEKGRLAISVKPICTKCGCDQNHPDPDFTPRQFR